MPIDTLDTGWGAIPGAEAQPARKPKRASDTGWGKPADTFDEFVAQQKQLGEIWPSVMGYALSEPAPPQSAFDPQIPFREQASALGVHPARAEYRQYQPAQQDYARRLASELAAMKEKSWRRYRMAHASGPPKFTEGPMPMGPPTEEQRSFASRAAETVLPTEADINELKALGAELTRLPRMALGELATGAAGLGTWLFRSTVGQIPTTEGLYYGITRPSEVASGYTRAGRRIPYYRNVAEAYYGRPSDINPEATAGEVLLSSGEEFAPTWPVAAAIKGGINAYRTLAGKPPLAEAYEHPEHRAIAELESLLVPEPQTPAEAYVKNLAAPVAFSILIGKAGHRFVKRLGKTLEIARHNKIVDALKKGKVEKSILHRPGVSEALVARIKGVGNLEDEFVRRTSRVYNGAKRFLKTGNPKHMNKAMRGLNSWVSEMVSGKVETVRAEYKGPVAVSAARLPSPEHPAGSMLPVRAEPRASAIAPMGRPPAPPPPLIPGARPAGAPLAKPGTPAFVPGSSVPSARAATIEPPAHEAGPPVAYRKAPKHEVYIKPEDVKWTKSWGGGVHLEYKERGDILHGQPVKPNQLPPLIYHVTTNIGGVLSTGSLRSMAGKRVGGLGKGTSIAHHGVSFTEDRGDALMIRRELLRAGELARGEVDPKEAITRYAREDERLAGLPAGSLDRAVSYSMLSYDSDLKYAKEHGEKAMRNLALHALRGYHTARSTFSNIQNPILFGDSDSFAGVRPETTAIVAVPSRSLPTKALIRRRPLGTEHLHEVIVHGEVPIKKAKVIDTRPPEVQANPLSLQAAQQFSRAESQVALNQETPHIEMAAARGNTMSFSTYIPTQEIASITVSPAINPIRALASKAFGLTDRAVFHFLRGGRYEGTQVVPLGQTIRMPFAFTVDVPSPLFNTKVLTPLSHKTISAFVSDFLERGRRSLDDAVVLDVPGASKKDAKHVIADGSGLTPRGYMEKLAKAPYMAELSKAFEGIVNEAKSLLSETVLAGAEDSQYAGIGLDPGAFGYNTVASGFGRKGPQLIFINPLEIASWAFEQAGDLEWKAKAAAEETFATIIHELVHSVERSEGDVLQVLIDKALDQLGDNFADTTRDQLASIYRKAMQAKPEDVPKGVLYNGKGDIIAVADHAAAIRQGDEVFRVVRSRLSSGAGGEGLGAGGAQAREAPRGGRAQNLGVPPEGPVVSPALRPAGGRGQGGQPAISYRRAKPKLVEQEKPVTGAPKRVPAVAEAMKKAGMTAIAGAARLKDGRLVYVDYGKRYVSRSGKSVSYPVYDEYGRRLGLRTSRSFAPASLAEMGKLDATFVKHMAERPGREAPPKSLIVSAENWYRGEPQTVHPNVRLREVLRSQAKGARMGAKAIKDMHSDLMDYAMKVLPPKYMKRVAKAIAKVQTADQAGKVLNTVSAIANNNEKQIIASARSLLKLTKTWQARGARVGYRAGKLDLAASQAELVEFILDRMPHDKELSPKLARIMERVTRATTPSARKRIIESVNAIVERYDHASAVAELRSAVKRAKDATVPTEYRDQIDTYLGLIRFTEPSEATIEKLSYIVEEGEKLWGEGSSSAIEIDPNVGLVPRWMFEDAKNALAGYASRALVRSMRTEEIRTLARLVDTIRRKGELSRHLEIAGKRRELEKLADDAAGEIRDAGPPAGSEPPLPAEGGQPSAEEPEGGIVVEWGKPPRRGALREATTTMTVGTEARIANVFGEWQKNLGELPSGKGYNAVYMQMLDGDRRAADVVLTVMEAFADAIQEAGYSHNELVGMSDSYARAVSTTRAAITRAKGQTPKWRKPAFVSVALPDMQEITGDFVKKRPKLGANVAELRLPRGVIMGIYALLDDPVNAKEAVKNKNFGVAFQTEKGWVLVRPTDRTIAALRRAIGPRDAAFVDRMKEFVNGWLFDVHNAAHVERTGAALAWHDRYWPAERLRDIFQKEPGAAFRRWGPTDLQGLSMNMPRTGGRPPLVAKDFFDMLGDHVTRVALYVGKENQRMNIMRLLESKKVQDAIKARFKYGDQEIGWLKKAVDSWYDSLIPGMDPQGSVVNMILRNAHRGYIGVHLGVPGYQVLSLPLYLLDASAKDVVRAIRPISKKALDVMRRNAQELYLRRLGMIHEMFTPSTTAPLPAGGLVRAMGPMDAVLLGPTFLTDRFASTSVSMNLAMAIGKRLGYTDEEIGRLATWLTDRSQLTFTERTMTPHHHAARTKPMRRAWLIFSSFRSKMWSRLALSVMRYKQKPTWKNFRNMVKTTTLVTLNAFTVHLFNRWAYYAVGIASAALLPGGRRREQKKDTAEDVLWGTVERLAGIVPMFGQVFAEALDKAHRMIRRGGGARQGIETPYTSFVNATAMLAAGLTGEVADFLGVLPLSKRKAVARALEEGAKDFITLAFGVPVRPAGRLKRAVVGGK